MARPWPKRSGWPYVAKNGRKSYNVGFYDHDKRERSRSFPSVRHAREWMDDYTTAERRGRDSLRRFLLDLDAKEANDAEARTIAEIIELYLDLNAHPRNEGGLAPSTYEQYTSMANRHLLGKPRRKRNGEPLPPARYATAVASVPAVRFNGPLAPRAWREEMMRAGVAQSSREHAWRVLSATLSWAAGSPRVPEIQTNGCNLVNEDGGNRRRSIRRGGTGYAPNGRRRGMLVPSWALSPQAVEAIRAEMLGQAGGRRDPILAHRDAVIVSLQYGLGARNQEIWGLRWMSLADDFVWVTEVLSHGQLDEWGKTEHSTQRRTIIPNILQEDLSEWRIALRRWGHAARDVDFIIPGDLAGAQYGVRERRTGACHLTHNQAKSWNSRCFKPVVSKVAERPEFVQVHGATPYALRRGGISLRLRSEDPQTVASECGTSLEVLSAHYAFVIEDLRRSGPRPADIEWRAARTAQTERRAQEQSGGDSDTGRKVRGRWKLSAWFAARRQGPQSHR